MKNYCLRLLLFLIVFMPFNLFGQSYDSLWKQVSEAEKQDLPQTQMTVLEKIIDKAGKEKNYGQLIKARLKHCQAMVEISPDSLQSAVERLKQQTEMAEKKEPALAAVLNSILGSVYEKNPQLADDASKLSADYYAKSLADPEMLSRHRTAEFEPLVEKGDDSEIFNNDLLHLLAFEAENYQLAYDYYKQIGNRRGMLICKFREVEQRFEDVEGTRFKTSKYTAALDSLIEEFGDLPECGEVAIARCSYMDDCTDVSIDDRIAYIHEAQNRWGSWKRIKWFQEEEARLRQPMFSLSVEREVTLPDRPIQVSLSSIRNVPQLTITVTRLNHTGESEINANLKNEKLKLISGSEKVYTKDFFFEQEYYSRKDSMEIGPLPVGIYLVEVTAPKNKIDKRRMILYVSNLLRLEESLPNNKVRYVVVNATTGQPVPGAKIKLTIPQGYRKADKVVNLTCDKKGEVIYQADEEENRRPDKVFVSAGDDRYLPDRSFWGGRFYYNNDERTRDIISVYTDRSIYRPGQTVHVSVLAHQVNDLQTQALEGKHYTVRLLNANYKTVEEKEVTTDAYGTASIDFALPTNGLTGRFQVQIPNHGSTSFRVEEYKRPTFQVEFDEVKEAYKSGDVVTVTGRAKTYAGVPVQGAKVSFNVVRTRSWWWRWFDSDDYDEELSVGEVTTDEKGEFQIEVPLELPEWVEEDDLSSGGPLYRRPRFYSFNVRATVTDQGGESHEASTNVPLGSKPTAFSCQIAERSEKKDLKEFTFSLRNAAGQEVEGTVNYSIDGKEMGSVKANEKVAIDALSLSSGQHVIEATCAGDTIKEEFVVFSLSDKVPCIETHDWFYRTSTSFPRDGGPVTIQIGSSDKDTHVVYSIISGNRVIESGTLKMSNSIITREFKYKEEYGTGLCLCYAWVKEGVVYTHSTLIERPLPDKKLKVNWVTFRDLLTPGQQEEWTLNITHPDGTPANAQFMATMYDKSLDQLAMHYWNFSTGITQSLPYNSWEYLRYGLLRLSASQKLPKITYPQIAFSSFTDDITEFAEEFSYFGVRRRMVGEVPGIMAAGATRNNAMVLRSKAAVAVEESASMDMADENVLQEVVTVNASTRMKKRTGGNGIDIGSNDQQLDESQVRENLNETAFFYPALVSDENGHVAIRFTLPESVTTWKFMGLAHDKEMNYGMLDSIAVAKKDVMVQPNMPRFLRTGDKASITTKIFNTAEKDITGQVGIRLIDPETEQTVFESTQPFSVKQGDTGSATFRVEPNEQTPSLLICKIIANGDGFSDGEQHYLPILPNSEMVTNTLPFTQHEPGVKTIDLTKLIPSDAKNTKITVEYTNNPAWLMVQTLPFVGDVNEKNAISLAAAYYANSIAANLIAQVPQVKTVFQQWQREEGNETSLMSALEKNQDLKALLLNETPWVLDADDEAQQKKALATFFDENALGNRQRTSLELLKKLQKGDGSFSWWEGMHGSPSMTAEVMEFLTRLNLLIGTDPETKTILSRANNYLSKIVIDEVADMKKREKKGEKIYIWYSHALQWVYINAISGRQLNAKEQDATDYLLAKLEKMNTKQSMYAKAKMAVVLARNGKKEKADVYMKSLKEYMVYTEEQGRYFDTPRAGYSWCDYRIPTQTAVIEAWQLLTPNDQQTITELRRWLLMQKRTQNWDTPINCVNAVFAFLNGNTQLLAKQEPTVIKVDGQSLDLPKATAGMGYVKTVVPAQDAKVLTADKSSTGTSWGAVYAQFLQPTSSVEDHSSGLKVRRQLLTEDGKPVTSLKVGDRVKVRLTIEADHDYDYVQLIDKRAACMEPVNQRSGYHWGYYCAPKDQTTQYYFDILSKGKHVVEAEYYIDRPGTYETGTCVVQCAYSPEYMGTTKSQTIVIK